MSSRLDAILSELSRDLSAWRGELLHRPRDEAAAMLAELHGAWVRGELGPRLARDGDELALDRAIGRVITALPEELVEPLETEHWASCEADARRWCWAPGWLLMSQDEDLLLMRDDWIAALLEEATERCTKRDYVLRIVEHHVRDSVHHALWQGEAELLARLAWAAEVASLAGPAGADALVEYATRIASYAEPRRVKREEMHQRVLDLRRCYAHEHLEPEIKTDGATWVARVDRANVQAGRLVVSARDGRMSAALVTGDAPTKWRKRNRS